MSVTERNVDGWIAGPTPDQSEVKVPTTVTPDTAYAAGALPVGVLFESVPVVPDVEAALYGRGSADWTGSQVESAYDAAARMGMDPEVYLEG